MLAALLAGVWPPSVLAQAGTWAPDQRLIISDFTTIVGVATDGWRIYAASANGLITYDPARQTWEQPVTLEDEFPVLEEPTSLAWSPAVQALVLGTRQGRLWRVDAVAGRVEPLGAVPASVFELRTGSAGDLYIRTPAGWYLLEAGSMAPRPAASVPAAAANAADRRLESLGGVLGLDQGMRRWPVTGWTAGTRPDEYYVGTAGGGLLEVDTRTLQITARPYGGTGRGVSALARAGGMIWFAGFPGSPGRGRVASADTGLQRWRWPDPNRYQVPAQDVAVMAPWLGSVWVGARDGLFRTRPETGSWDRFDARSGLPSNSITALASADSALWIGTRQGACLWQHTGCGPTLLAGREVTALSYCDGALWIGTDRELVRATANALEPVAAPGLPGGVQALACLQGALYVAAPRTLLVHAGGSWKPPMAIGGGGAVRKLVASDDAIWVAGDQGAARWDPAAGEWSTYLVGSDIPIGPVLDVLPDGNRLWLATPAGALRLELRPR